MKGLFSLLNLELPSPKNPGLRDSRAGYDVPSRDLRHGFGVETRELGGGAVRGFGELFTLLDVGNVDCGVSRDLKVGWCL